MNEDEIRELIVEAMSSQTRAKAKDSDYGDPDAKKFPIMSQASVLSAARLIGKPGYPAEKKAAVIARIKRIAKRKGYYLPKSWRTKTEAFAMSDVMTADAIQSALNDEKDPDMDGDDDSGYPCYERGYVRHVFADGTFVFQMGWDGDWFKRSYTIDANGEATLGDSCTQVQPQLSFAPFSDRDATESMASQAMASLDNRDSAVPFDKAYLQKASQHHETAIHLATKASTEGKDERVRKLASKIVKDHSPHLAEMNTLSTSLYPTDSDGDHDNSPPGEKGESLSSAPYTREVLESTRVEATDDGEDGFHISGTAINPGVNRSKTRHYSKETLSAAIPLFKGKKMYIDHPTALDEKNGVRSFRDAGAVIESAWTNSKGGIDYTAVVIDPPLREKLNLMRKAGALDSMGVSVNYRGVGSPIEYEGRYIDDIESIDDLNSLDFVTEPGAWGDIARVESLTVPAVEQQEGTFVMDEETKKLIESLKARLDESDKARVESDKQRAESDRKAQIANTQVSVKLALEKSGLPKVSQDRLLKSYEGAETADDIETVIAGEKEFIEGLFKEAKVTPRTAGRDNVRPINRRNGVVVGLGNTGRTESAGVEEEEEETPEITPEAFGASMEGFIPNGADFARRMG